jgi:hypothetical protein
VTGISDVTHHRFNISTGKALNDSYQKINPIYGIQNTYPMLHLSNYYPKRIHFSLLDRASS